nr:hypothetical protein HK105_006404 [Polyrhizophydium stewartii]
MTQPLPAIASQRPQGTQAPASPHVPSPNDSAPRSAPSLDLPASQGLAISTSASSIAAAGSQRQPAFVAVPSSGGAAAGGLPSSASVGTFGATWSSLAVNGRSEPEHQVFSLCVRQQAGGKDQPEAQPDQPPAPQAAPEPPELIETVQFTGDSTLEEVKAVLLALADIGEDNVDAFDITLVTPGGQRVAADPWALLRYASSGPTDVLDMDVDKLTFGKPYGMLSKTPKKIDPKYLSIPRYTFSDDIRKWLRSPTFDNWQFDDNELIALFELLFEEMNLMTEFDIKPATLRKFLHVVRENYNNNMYGIINVTELINKLKPVEKLVLTVACIGHDLDHPGYNNAYQINACLFNILKRDDCNILGSLSESVYREVRKNVIRCIMSTDMVRHGEILGQFKKAAEAFNYDDPEHRILAKPWVNCLLEEFFSQSDREKAEGLPTAPFMDREKVTKASAQIGFIGYVMIPLYELVGKVLPNMEEHVITPIKDSLAYYKELLEAEKAEKK